MDRLNLLVVEDGEEYTAMLTRFLTDAFAITRAGDGADALRALAVAPFDVVFLDMRFDRVPPDALLGDLAQVAERFNGDPVRARHHLETNQGTYVLDAIRAAGHRLPAVYSYDFDAEPRRWQVLQRRGAPVDYLPDNASAAVVRERLLRVAGRRSTSAP